jgi:hypothetical protein
LWNVFPHAKSGKLLVSLKEEVSMYKEVEKSPEVFMESAAIVTPVATLEDDCGAKCHIIRDDHCYVLCIEQEDGSCRPATHIFKEAFQVMRRLPPPV